MNNYEKKVRIKICSDKFDNSDMFFSDSSKLEDESVSDKTRCEHFEFVTEGTLSSLDGRISLNYNDSELFEGESTGVALTFDEAAPGLVTMLRSGSVSTAMVFEAGQRHISVYKTPYMPFELCIRTRKVVNQLLSQGTLEIDYFIEVHGVRTERTKMKISVSEIKNVCNS